MQLHELRRQIEKDTGKRCAIVYGSLPPETRAVQADLFNDPNNDYDYLVASDAIGMGLNLSVKRIIFNSVSRFNGTEQVPLTIPQIKQIGGRAGRYKSAHQATNQDTTGVSNTSSTDETVGWVTTIDEADLPTVNKALSSNAPPLQKAGLNPPAEIIEEYSRQLPTGVPFEYLLRKIAQVTSLHQRFFLCDSQEKFAIARLIDDIPGLTIEQRVNITAAPCSMRQTIVCNCLREMARAIADFRSITVISMQNMPLSILEDEPRADRLYLESLEILHQSLILYLWLSYRFPSILRDQPMAQHAKSITEQKIRYALSAFSANPALRARLKKLQAQEAQRVLEAANAADEFSQEMARLEQEESSNVIDEVPQQVFDGVEEHHVEGQENNGEGINSIQQLVSDETLEEHFAVPKQPDSEFNVQYNSDEKMERESEDALPLSEHDSEDEDGESRSVASGGS